MAGKQKPKKLSLKLDPAVEAYLTADPTQVDTPQWDAPEITLTPYQRRKRERDANRVRDWYDLPSSIKKNMETIAKIERVPKSQLAAFFLFDAIQRYETGEITLAPFKTASNIPRFQFFLRLPIGEHNPNRVKS